MTQPHSKTPLRSLGVEEIDGTLCVVLTGGGQASAYFPASLVNSFILRVLTEISAHRASEPNRQGAQGWLKTEGWAPREVACEETAGRKVSLRFGFEGESILRVFLEPESARLLAAEMVGAADRAIAPPESIN